MKLALLSDIHANLQAMQACMAHAQLHGANRFALLGDLVGYGGNPSEVMDLVMSLASQGAWVVKGNHDDMAVHPPANAQHIGSSTAAWTHQQLDAHQLAFLQQLPLTITHDHVMLVHASAHNPDTWRYVDDERSAAQCLSAAQTTHAATQHVLVGHVHHQCLFYQGHARGLMPFKPTPGVAVPFPTTRAGVVTIGSVGQPRDGDPRAMYALLDLGLSRLTFHRVAYDHTAAAAAIRAAGLPDYFAHRLETGH
jgi:diadenosine tetraphosphatase ApaH/serine/threonine PP2A family protein phosphatase